MEPDWVWGFVGGLMIGAAASLYLLVNGRIMGASGIVGDLVDGSGRATAPERLAFLVGLIAVPPLMVPLTHVVDTHITDKLWVIIAAGLLVGVGTRLANGCTSGHGVCGIARLSPRGIAATALYLLAGGLVMFLARHLGGMI
ncbi:MAG: YeeE/YedE family protein [Rhodobacterales bacterium]|nr:YeeE/YedE family protein [Rhodobacterales bacterium]NCO17188.1 YeeE/YedE family protein [Alphaproteobacteria bacterium]